MDSTTFWAIIIIIIAAIVFFVALILLLRERKKNKEMPSHLELYFDDNIRKIMGEWDMVTRDRVKSFKKDMKTRLSDVGKEIGSMENSRKKLDTRMNALDREMSKLERF